MSVFLLLTAAGLCSHGSADDLPRRAADLLVERCVSCHGPESDEPKALRGWADATDLGTTVLDPELVVPGDPQDSYLYLVIEDGDMPPEDGDIPQLSPEEQGVISDWITAGAKLPAPPQVEESSDDSSEGPVTDPGPRPTPAGSWMKAPWPKWFGRLHPVVVHFPIALLTAALIAELLAKLLRKPSLRTAATFTYTLGALSALPAAAFGWLLAESTSHRGDTLDIHRWLGVGVGALAILGMRLFYTRPAVRLPLLFVLAGLAGAAGHLGGELSYGADWLRLP